MQYTWFLSQRDNCRYANTVIKGKRIGLHNLIMGSLWVDHKNGDGLDNTRMNLRLATASQNAQNRKLRSDSTTGYKGVSKHWNRFRAYIGDEHIGVYDTPLEAALAYDKEARKRYGEFARTNFAYTAN